MSEIEIKILEIDREQIIKKLEDLGAKKIFDGQQHAIYYDFPDRPLFTEGKTLRLRNEGSTARLTIKLSLRNALAKEQLEHEVEISDFGLMRNILEIIGLIPWLEIRKHRTSFEWNGSHFELDRYLDEYQHIPEFLEIESTDTDRLFEHAKILGYSKDQCKAWDIVQLASYYRKHEATI